MTISSEIPVHFLVETYPANAITVRCSYTLKLNCSIKLQTGNFWIVPLWHSVSDMATINSELAITEL
jgi:hypothetical protein